MITVCSFCQGVVSQDDEPPIVAADGMEMVSHGAHQACMLQFYGEDFAGIVGGQPT